MTPEEVREIVDERLTQKLRELLMGSVQPSRFMSDEEVCQLLDCSRSKLRSLVSKGELVAGAHFTGSGRTRRWMRDRVERYLETRNNPAVQLRDIKQWKRQ